MWVTGVMPSRIGVGELREIRLIDQNKKWVYNFWYFIRHIQLINRKNSKKIEKIYHSRTFRLKIKYK